jgi:hypothetical protein
MELIHSLVQGCLCRLQFQWRIRIEIVEAGWLERLTRHVIRASTVGEFEAIVSIALAVDI